MTAWPHLADEDQRANEPACSRSWVHSASSTVTWESASPSLGPDGHTPACSTTCPTAHPRPLPAWSWTLWGDASCILPFGSIPRQAQMSQLPPGQAVLRCYLSPGFSRWIQGSHKGLYEREAGESQRGGSEEGSQLALAVENRPYPSRHTASGSCTSQDTDSPPELPEARPCLHLDLAL